jgi:hypothetical protein
MQHFGLNKLFAKKTDIKFTHYKLIECSRPKPCKIYVDILRLKCINLRLQWIVVEHTIEYTERIFNHFLQHGSFLT